MRYAEAYVDGKLAKRTWYKILETETGTKSEVERTEMFE